jgi:hypothetical protein
MLYIPEVSAKFMDLSHDILKVGQLSIKGKTERFLKEKKRKKIHIQKTERMMM